MNLLTVFQQGDAVLVSVFLILITMSVLTWYLIAVRGVQAWRTHRANRIAEIHVWESSNWTSAEQALRGSQSPYARLVHDGLAALRHYRAHADRTLGAACGVDEFLTRRLRKRLAQENGRLEAGMTLLASIGSTAPFVGLFGTVWGIYHALVGIAAQGQVSIATVSGPIGEALVATAAGLAAAIPAVLAYNGYTRLNRLTAQDMDHFTHDLHAQLLTHAAELGDAPREAPAPARAPLAAVRAV